MGRPQGLGAGESDPCGANINIPIILSYYNSFPSPAGPPATQARSHGQLATPGPSMSWQPQITACVPQAVRAKTGRGHNDA